MDINHQDKEGKTALHYALKPTDYGILLNTYIIETLLKAKANPMINDKYGFNVLDYAAEAP